MLVLSRKATERIAVGENITIEVRRIAGNRVTLAIDAPRDIRILRGELAVAATEFETDANGVDEPETYHVSHHRVPLAAPTVEQTSPTTAVG